MQLNYGITLFLVTYSLVPNLRTDGICTLVCLSVPLNYRTLPHWKINSVEISQPRFLFQLH